MITRNKLVEIAALQGICLEAKILVGSEIIDPEEYSISNISPNR